MLHISCIRVLTPISALLLGGVSLPAVHAAPAPASQCPREEVCVWSGTNYSGTVTSIQDESCDTRPVGSAANDDPDRLQELRIYAEPNCTGTEVVVKSGAVDPNVSGRSYQNWHDPHDPVEGP